MARKYQMRAKDSVTAAIFLWQLSTLDFSGTGYTGPNAATNIMCVGYYDDGAGGGGGSGDVVGPGVAVNARIAVFSGTTGKLIADGGSTIAGVLSSAASAASAGDASTLSSAQSYADAVGASVAASIPAAGGDPVNVTKAAANAGTGTAYSLANHKHDVDTAAPADQACSAASAEGNAPTLARSNHTHRFTGAAGRWAVFDASGNMADSDTTLNSKTIRRSAADAVGAELSLGATRGTSGAPTANSALDLLGSLKAEGHDGSSTFVGGRIRFRVIQAAGTSKRTRAESLIHDGTNEVTTGTFERLPPTLTTDATLTQVFTIPIGNNQTFEVSYVLHGQSGSDVAHRKTSVTAYRGAGNASELAHSDAVNYKSTGAAGWGSSLEISHVVTNTTFDLQVKGAGSTNVTWTGEITVTVYS